MRQALLRAFLTVSALATVALVRQTRRLGGSGAGGGSGAAGGAAVVSAAAGVSGGFGASGGVSDCAQPAGAASVMIRKAVKVNRIFLLRVCHRPLTV